MGLLESSELRLSVGLEKESATLSNAHKCALLPACFKMQFPT